MKIQVNCMWCGESKVLVVSEQDYRDWRDGKHSQDAFPYLSDNDRELMISHTCGPCFDNMFPEEEED